MRIWQNAGWLIGGKSVNALLSLGYLALATRALGLEGFGQLALIVALGQGISQLVSFQTWQLVVQWGDDTKAGAALGFAIALDIASAAVGIALAGAAFLLLPSTFGVLSDLAWPAFLFCVVSMLTIRSTPIGILRLRDRFAHAAMADTLTPIIRLLGAIAAFLAGGGVVEFLAIWGVAEIVTAAAYWWFALKNYPPTAVPISMKAFPRKTPGSWTFVVSTSLTGSLGALSRQGMLILVGMFGGAAAAGIYRIAAQLGNALLKLAQSILRATYPELVRNDVRTHNSIGRIVGISSGLFAIAFLLALLLGGPAIRLLAGAQFSNAYLPMLILIAAAGCELIGASMEALLIARQRVTRNMLLRAVPLGLSLFALPMALNWQGVTGAALCIFAASATTLGAMSLETFRTNSPSD
ncbi:lipopolysaccharide biosynthesis protein [Erythrobacter litoralis]|uniref:lipopolysaccharide biosynthesis protein n=1 Tax=Erythrobacter litoralis TaxID=39960 RepID=UPI002435AB49|nr:oligosaccharide flippase family protein [Erythrobacter litoralis]MDG6078941.1 lipopolysaccharide biosynthesis protein [Erythrobacter litoralis]